MATLSNILLDKEILLESGTNELEVLVFNVAEYTFGINVAKVREVLPAAGITQLPHAHRSIRGVFKLRNHVIPCVSLFDYFGIASKREDAESTMILIDLNQQQTAFLVDQVERIHRLSWENILAVPGIEALSHTPVTALARCDKRLIVMLDFEMILDNVTEQLFRTDEVANPLGVPREEFRILFAEDSPTVREAIEATLRASGYAQLEFFENGHEAWQWIQAKLNATGSVENVADLLIADVEMPQVDGLHLTKLVKEHPQLKSLPVLLYSSIITPDNRKKGAAVGADAQVSKPELTRVVELADELISTSRRRRQVEQLRSLTQETPLPEPAPKPASATQPASMPREADAAASPMPKLPDAPTVSVAIETPAAEAQPTQPTTTPVRPMTTPVLPTASAQPAAAPAALQTPTPGTAAKSSTSSAPDRLRAKLPNTETHLWKTFLHELTTRVAGLRQCLRDVRAGKRGDATFREAARLLHTIKSASMVVPFDTVTRCAHHLETLLESAREDRSRWPVEETETLLEWLDDLTKSSDIAATLIAAEYMESELTARARAVAG